MTPPGSQPTVKSPLPGGALTRKTVVQPAHSANTTSGQTSQAQAWNCHRRRPVWLTQVRVTGLTRDRCARKRRRWRSSAGRTDSPPGGSPVRTTGQGAGPSLVKGACQGRARPGNPGRSLAAPWRRWPAVPRHHPAPRHAEPLLDSKLRHAGRARSATWPAPGTTPSVVEPPPRQRAGRWLVAGTDALEPDPVRGRVMVWDWERFRPASGGYGRDHTGYRRRPAVVRGAARRRRGNGGSGAEGVAPVGIGARHRCVAT